MSARVGGRRIWQIATSASTGTGTTKTTLNGAVDLKLWTLGASQWIGDVIDYQAATAAYTAAQSSSQRIFHESTDIGGIGPKEYVMPSTHGGLGTFAAAMVPLLQARPLNIKCQGGQNITVSAQAQIANTAAFRVGVAHQLREDNPGVQIYYTAPTNETSTGTAAGNVDGNDITINSAGTILGAYGRFAVSGTVTASESYVARGRLTSSQFQGVQFVDVPMQPIAAGLGTAVEVLQPGDIMTHFVLPFTNPCTINTAINLEEALTAAISFQLGVQYSKN